MRNNPRQRLQHPPPSVDAIRQAAEGRRKPFCTTPRGGGQPDSIFRQASIRMPLEISNQPIHAIRTDKRIYPLVCQAIHRIEQIQPEAKEATSLSIM